MSDQKLTPPISVRINNANNHSEESSSDYEVVNNPSEPTKTDTNRQKNNREIGGPKGLEPTRYGDWEKGGRCIDF